MPDPNQNNDNQNPVSPTVMDISSVDQPVITPSSDSTAPSVIPPPVTPPADPIVAPVNVPPIPPETQATDATNQVSEIPSFLHSTDLPPLAPDFQNVSGGADTVNKTEDKNVPDANSGTNAPFPDLPITTGSPKKKFGGGKIIATILGIFLLIGGIAGGVILTQQNQNLSEKAGGDPDYTICNTTNALMGYCSPPAGGGNGCISAGCGSEQICHIQGGQTGTYGVCVNATSFITACTGDGRQPSHNSNNPSAWTCCAAGYVAGPNQQGCVPNTTGTNPPGGTNPPATNPPGTNPPGTNPPNNPTAQCQNIKAYSSTWALLTDAQLSTLTPSTVVNFCVLGTASEGTFDRAKFTINTVAQAETTTKRPTTNDFCQSYAIPAGVTSFNLTAQIHHATLGWK